MFCAILNIKYNICTRKNREGKQGSWEDWWWSRNCGDGDWGSPESRGLPTRRHPDPDGAPGGRVPHLVVVRSVRVVVQLQAGDLLVGGLHLLLPDGRRHGVLVQPVADHVHVLLRPEDWPGSGLAPARWNQFQCQHQLTGALALSLSS